MRKYGGFLALLLVTALLLSGGCGGGGGGGGNSSDPEGDTPTPSPTPSATFKVTFDSNGGTAVTSQTVKSGETVTKPDNPSKSGNAFVGWYTDNSTFKNMFLFGSGGDAVTSDITLYANWVAKSAVETKYASAASAIVIGYRQGDSAGHVTGNVTLPTTIDGMSNLTVSWTSNNASVISASGVVTRPAIDTEVTLTASISDGTTTEPYMFKMTVMKDTSSNSERGQARQSIHDNDYYEVVAMNTGENEVYFTYDSSNGARRISTIQGIYRKSPVQDMDDALDAIQGVHSLLGVSNPSDELDVAATNSDDYGSQYSFSQIYNGRKVYGRSVTVSTNAEGTTNYLASSLYPTASLANIVETASNAAVSIAAGTPTPAEQAALAYHEGGDFKLGRVPTEEIIFTLKEYQEDGSIVDYGANPVVAYMVNICGTDSADKYLDENVFVNADTGKVICAISNIHDATKVSARGKDEKGNSVSFDVTYTDAGKFSLSTNIPPLVQMHQSDSQQVISPVVNEENEWDNDGQAVSAYTNMISVVNWWSEKFERNSLDNNGMGVGVIVHDKSTTDNAFWHSGIQQIFICDPGTLFDYSCAVAKDALTHESTHAVVQYSIGGSFASYYRNAPGAINEGYADIFACLNDKNWTIGEELFDEDSSYTSLRNIATPNDRRACTQGPSELSGDYFIDYTRYPYWDHGGVHTNSLLVSHAAYLMHKNGLTWDELGKVWYRSMFTGLYSIFSDFHTVRRAVLEAARQMNWSAEKMNIIAAAFDEEKIYATKGTLSGTVTNASGYAVGGATVVATRDGTEFGRTMTGTDGKYSLELGANTTYSILIKADSYAEFTATRAIDEGVNVTLDAVMNVVGTGSLYGTVMDMDEDPVAGAILTLRTGHRSERDNTTIGDWVATVTSLASGDYAIDDLPNGAYNIAVSKAGYVDIVMNVTVSGATKENIFVPAGTANREQYNIYLSWGDNIAGEDEPFDLDAHVIEWLDNDDLVEVYYYNKVEYVDDCVISLDRDVIRDRSNREDQTGPEHMVFDAHAADIDYFVHWYRGSGTWASSRARVLIVLPGAGLAHLFSVPMDTTIYSDNSQTCWHVMRLKNGMPEYVDEILTERKPWRPNSTSSTSGGNVSLSGFGSGSDHPYPPKAR